MALKRAHVVWIFVLLPIAPLWRAFFTGETIGLFDAFRPMPPWNGGSSMRPWDVLQADSVLQFYGWRDMVFEAWGKGELPLWNPYQLAGTPLLANSQSAGFYPLHMLSGVLHIPTPWAITLLAWLHLAWAGLGVFALARRIGAGVPGAILAGSAFCLSPFMLGWTALPSVISTCAWIPWCLICVYRLFGDSNPDPIPARPNKEKGSKSAQLKGTTISSTRAAAQLGFCTGMLLLAGHLQFAFYGLLAVTLLAVGLLLVQIRSKRTLKLAGLTMGGLLLGGLIAAPQLLPVLEYSKFSHRKNTPTEEGYRAFVAGAYPGPALLGLGFPNVLGHPAQPSTIEPKISSFWPAWTQRGANFAEVALGAGPLVLFFLALIPLRELRSREPLLLGVVGLIGFLLALGTPLNRLIYFGLPGFSSTGSPGRAGILLTLALCCLAGIGVQNLFVKEGVLNRNRVVLGFFVLMAFLAVPGLLAQAGMLVPNTTQEGAGDTLAIWIKATVTGAVPMMLVAIGLVGGVVVFALKLPKSLPLALSSGALCVVFVLYAWELIPTGSPLPQAASPNTKRIAVINASWDLLQAPPASLPPNTAVLLRHHDLAGYDSLLHKDTVTLLKEINGRDPAPPANGNMMFVWPSADPAKLAEAGVSEIWSRQHLPRLGTPDLQENGLWKYILQGFGRAFTPAGQAQITEEGYDHLKVQAKGPGTLVVKDRFMPGWRAFVDSKPVAMKPGLWREVELSEGDHCVEFRYDPPGLRLGLGLGALGWLGFLSLLIIRPRKN